MAANTPHEMLPRQAADELAQQRFVLALKRHVSGSLRPGVAVVYRTEVEPGFVAEHGRPPQTPDEAEAALDTAAHYRFTKAVNRTSQEMMWLAVGETVYRETARMEAAAERLATSPVRKGSLSLDPDLQPEPIYKDCFIHLQPEGYCPPDPDGRSVVAGAFYESGGRLYSMGAGMGARDSKAGAVIAWIKENRPGWTPRRILDMGCSAGGASTSYPAAFPEAEVHACDLGSSMLRYAHARAESLGASVHFHQMDATRTGFPDGHFDLVVSHNLLHEVSGDARRRLAGESLRLLAPGGLVIHQDVDLLFRGKAAWELAERSYDVRYNNEPFWVEYATSDMGADLVRAGFPAEAVKETHVRRTAGPGSWYCFIADKA
ncbi:MAG TPA: class I SAM-dependent methyltransferase [Caulobacteraceae bacterium]|nr:class I SAM-dependent methyltransferase [Caulobacteraceae bacterium]